MKKNIITIFCIIVIFIITTLIVSFNLVSNEKDNFKIISVNNISTDYHIKFERVNFAKDYEVVIYNDDNSVLYNQKTSSNDLMLHLKSLETNKKYRMVVFAYNNQGESISVKNPYIFTYNEPAFNRYNELVFTNNEDYYLMIDGNLNKKDYYLEIKDNEKIIKKDILKDNKYLITKNIFSNKEKIYTINLYDGNTIINTINIYSNISPISDIKITSPKSESILNYDDINLTYFGGMNASSYSLEIYKDDTLLKETAINGNSLIISKDFFKKGEKYTLRINALYNDKKEYTKSDTITFNMNDKDTLKQTYITKNINYFKDETLTIVNPNNTGNIYYTLDGTDPNENSTLYKEPIKIDKNTILKTIIKDKNKNDSKIATYNINLGTKKEYKVYLNLLTNSTNEQDLIKLRNVIESKLKKYNVIVYTNNLSNNINSTISEAKYNNVDLYLSIKTNESTSHELYGIETWINNEECLSYSLANIIHKNLISIYNEKSNRGIKYANNNLNELSNNNVSTSILINLGYMDNENDYNWLTSNDERIANTISDSILKYFGLI